MESTNLDRKIQTIGNLLDIYNVQSVSTEIRKQNLNISLHRLYGIYDRHQPFMSTKYPRYRETTQVYTAHFWIYSTTHYGSLLGPENQLVILKIQVVILKIQVVILKNQLVIKLSS